MSTANRAAEPTFRIYLPRLAECPDKSRGIASPAARGGNETILLVEDEPFLRSTIRMVLTQLGYHVLEADQRRRCAGSLETTSK